MGSFHMRPDRQELAALWNTRTRTAGSAMMLPKNVTNSSLLCVHVSTTMMMDMVTPHQLLHHRHRHRRRHRRHKPPASRSWTRCWAP